MTTIFGYPTVEAEIVGLINTANANYGAAFVDGDLTLTAGDYDSLESRQRFSVQDNSGKYFGVIDNIGIFKRNFQTLFKGITINVQAASGQTNREVLAVLCEQQGLPTFTDSDFADGLLDLNIDATDEAVQVTWPFSANSWGWTGSIVFYLTNVKNSLATLIPDGDIDGITQVSLSGVTWALKETALNGLTSPNWNDLTQVIGITDLEGLEYPGDQDLGLVITVTELDGLDYPSAQDISGLTPTLVGLEYYPVQDMSTLSGNLTGVSYPDLFVANTPSAWAITQCIDFSDYENAIARYRVGSEITDASLVNVITGKIVSTWPSLNTEASVSKMNVAFTRAVVNSITTARSVGGWTVSVKLKLASSAFLTGYAVLKYDIISED